MLKAVLFDLDGTLLPMDLTEFSHAYFGRLMKCVCVHGYTQETFFGAMKAGISAMSRNDGSRSNEDAFWDAFSSVCGPEVLHHRPDIDRFYEVEFDEVASSCGFNPRAAKLVRSLTSRGIRVALATNPMLPRIATQKRIRWAGLTPEDFELYTTYEDYSSCKPNPAYYLDVLSRMGLTPDDCIMVGNDVSEDMMAAAEAGIRGFLLTDCLINTPGADINAYPHGGYDELEAYVEGLLS